MSSPTACRLCGKEGQLQNSHIVSKFIWRMSKVIGNGSPFHAICLNQPDLSKKIQQDGFKEYLLCLSCERQRSTYEDHARRSLFKNIRNIQFDGKHAILTGLEYKPLKLYSMFQIWMMGVSTHPFYSHVNLGPHADLLAELLRNEEPSEPWRYGSTIAVLGGQNGDFAGIFSQPEQTRMFSHHVYRFVVAGSIAITLFPGMPRNVATSFYFFKRIHQIKKLAEKTRGGYIHRRPPCSVCDWFFISPRFHPFRAGFSISCFGH
jgi:hypothetical protein